MNVSSGLGELHYCSTAYGDRVMGSNSVDELRRIEFDADDEQRSGVKPTYWWASQFLSMCRSVQKRCRTCSSCIRCACPCAACRQG